ncbi:hypothetical protein SAMN02927930_00081 [Pseudidiomarina indica]|uniref:DUF192 domain-containing protein n=1 Tax=Pseudidiomarina indica TaxID=1159017 RepID=A0A1G6A390_9GAMM|nr:DUF192 domain-containing protein [Pseudidiomarina indica]SDB02463.1 hypothetical protein SAMN02927930_00081 [Pseudidiomarina indica]
MKKLMFAALGLMATPAMATTVDLCVADHPHQITVEVADTFESRARGLMGRDHLPEHAGMWFVYDEQRPGDAGFWMYNTYIPLDIAYLNENMEIVSIITMEPCPSIIPEQCPGYRPNVPYYGAIELNKNYFKRYGIGLGRQFKLCDMGE